MNITITSAHDEPFSLQLNYPREFSGLQQLEERYSQKNAPWGNLSINELWFDGACVFQSIIEANKSCRLNMQCDNSCWLMNFVLDGELAAAPGISNGAGLKAGEYNCLYCSNLDIEAGIDTTTHIFTVCLTRRFIKNLFWKTPIFNDDDLSTGKKTIFVTGNQPITRQLKAIITEINQAEQPSYIRRIYLEGKILELLSLQLRDSRVRPVNEVRPATSNTDLQKLETVRQLLEANIKKPYSLIELAKKSGLNDFKLKKGFKEAYGKTVFGYLAELRMQKAQKLLQNGLPVNEVADTVGYKNAHHFTTAFKKRFGVLPSMVNIKN